MYHSGFGKGQSWVEARIGLRGLGCDEGRTWVGDKLKYILVGAFTVKSLVSLLMGSFASHEIPLQTGHSLILLMIQYIA